MPFTPIVATLGYVLSPDRSRVLMVHRNRRDNDAHKGKYNGLSQELRSIIDYAVQAASADMSWKAIDRNTKDYEELKKQGVRFYKTPDAILRAQLDAWDRVVAKKSKENPHFQKVLNSQRAFAEKAGRWQADYMVDFRMAWNRYFGKQQPAKKG